MTASGLEERAGAGSPPVVLWQQAAHRHRRRWNTHPKAGPHLTLPQDSPATLLHTGKRPPQQPRVHSSPHTGTAYTMALVSQTHLSQNQTIIPALHPLARPQSSPEGQLMLITEDGVTMPASQAGLEPV